MKIVGQIKRVQTDDQTIWTLGLGTLLSWNYNVKLVIKLLVVLDVTFCNAHHVNTDLAWVILQTTEANTKVLSLSIVVLGTATKQVACVFPFSVSWRIIHLAVWTREATEKHLLNVKVNLVLQSWHGTHVSFVDTWNIVISIPARFVVIVVLVSYTISKV